MDAYLLEDNSETEQKVSDEEIIPEENSQQTAERHNDE
jgi:hypothetical protein